MTSLRCLTLDPPPLPARASYTVWVIPQFRIDVLGDGEVAYTTQTDCGVVPTFSLL